MFIYIYIYIYIYIDIDIYRSTLITIHTNTIIGQYNTATEDTNQAVIMTSNVHGYKSNMMIARKQTNSKISGEACAAPDVPSAVVGECAVCFVGTTDT